MRHGKICISESGIETVDGLHLQPAVLSIFIPVVSAVQIDSLGLGQGQKVKIRTMEYFSLVHPDFLPVGRVGRPPSV